jgi:hypothetical protein
LILCDDTSHERRKPANRFRAYLLGQSMSAAADADGRLEKGAP